MRAWLLMFLLLLSILIHDAQGIRVIKGSLQAIEQPIIHQEKASNNEGVEDGILCKSKKCSGRIRKLVTMIHISSTTTTNAKNDDKNEEHKDDERIARKEENISVNSSSKSQQLGPENMDISEMDYSLQARRKPPIHN